MRQLLRARLKHMSTNWSTCNNCCPCCLSPQRTDRWCTIDRVLMENWVWTFEAVDHEGAITFPPVYVSERVCSMSAQWKGTVYTSFICPSVCVHVLASARKLKKMVIKYKGGHIVRLKMESESKYLNLHFLFIASIAICTCCKPDAICCFCTLGIHHYLTI